MTPEQRRYARYAWITGLLILLLIALVDLTVHHHAHFEGSDFVIDSMPEFYPAFGFLAAFALILVAKTLAIALKRKDTYYADD